MKLSPNFTLQELIYSDTARRYKINNTPTPQQLKVLQHTCVYFLEPLRKLLSQHYGSACIKITSGYRCLALNRKLGSKDNSQHVKCEAVDMQVIANKKYISYIETYNLIKNWVKQGKLSVDQLICERSGDSCWVHASYSASGATKNRKQFLIYRNGKYEIDK